MKSVSVLILVTLMVIINSSCEHKNGADDDNFKSLVVEYNFSLQKYELNEKYIHSLKKPRELNSFVAKFFYKLHSTLNLDYENPVKLNLIKTSSDLYMSQDLSSLKSISTYYIYERYYNFHNKLGLLSYSPWPKKVVVDAIDSENSKNNALHAPFEVSTFYVPFDPYNVPANLNSGIVAHEENHGVFFNQVMKSISEKQYKRANQMISLDHGSTTGRFAREEMAIVYGEKKAELVEYNHLWLRAVDEGLADFAGYIFSNSANFFYASLNYESGRDFSRIVGSSLVEPLPSATELQELINIIKNPALRSTSSQYRAMSSSLSRLLNLSYRMAGQISSLFNIIATKMEFPEKPNSLTKQEYFYKLIIESLSDLEKVVQESYGSKRINFNDLLTVIFKGKKISTEVCEVLKKEVSDLLTLEGCTDE